MNRLSLLAEFAVFLKENKKLWLLPIVLVLVLLGALLVYVQGSALAPVHLHYLLGPQPAHR